LAARTRSPSGARPRVFLSGLPGVTSHQTRSRSSRFIAIRQAPREASGGGSNVPPNKPMRMPGAWGGSETRGDGITRPVHRESSPPRKHALRAVIRAQRCGGRLRGYAYVGRSAETPPERSRPDLPRTAHAVFKGGQLLGADRPARVEAAGGDADLGAEAELAAVGELGRGVVQDDGGIDLVQEFLRRGAVLGHDRVGVVRAEALDMSDRIVHAVDDLGGD